MEVKLISSVGDIALPGKGTVDIPRGDSVLRIPIKTITAAEQQDIMERFQAPAPPFQPRKNSATGQIEFTKNESDPAWIESVRRLEQQQTKAFFLSGLDFKVEGDNVNEQYSSIAERLSMGEALMVIQSILEMSRIDDATIEKAKNSLSRTPTEESVEK